MSGDISGVVLCAGFFLALCGTVWIFLNSQEIDDGTKLDQKRRERVTEIVEKIERLAIPAGVMERAFALLAEKGVQLDAKQQEFMAQGFRDFLVAVTYNRYIDHAGSRNHAVSMTSDTVDMLWHAWLEQADYEDFFTKMLGFRLVHVPETPERVASQRGDGKIDLLKTKPHFRAVQTYHVLVASPPLVKRRAQSSALYMLDRAVGNPHGFYYNSAILAALGRADFNTRTGNVQGRGFAPASNCRDAGAKERGADGDGAVFTGAACGSGSDSHSGGGGVHHGCNAGHGCGAGCGGH